MSHPVPAPPKGKATGAAADALRRFSKAAQAAAEIFDELSAEERNLIPADDLRVGDVLVGKRRNTEVKEISVCPGQWRTHIHVNRYACYDGRSLVEVK